MKKEEQKQKMLEGITKCLEDFKQYFKHITPDILDKSQLPETGVFKFSKDFNLDLFNPDTEADQNMTMNFSLSVNDMVRKLLQYKSRKFSDNEKMYARVIKEVTPALRYIARDFDGELWIYKNEPVKEKNFTHWVATGDTHFGDAAILNKSLFKGISFEDPKSTDIYEIIGESEDEE